MLPGPGLAPLVIGEGVDAGDQQAGLAARPQAHVDLVQPAGGGMHGQQMHHALRESQEEHLVVDAAPAVGFLLRAAGIVQEHQIQVRGITELHAAELAVADHAQAHVAARRSLAAAGHAECGRELLPGQPQGTAR